MFTWHQFYQAVRDPSWPDCATEDSYPLLPDFIRQECETVHSYVPGSFKHANRQPLLVHPISQVPESILNAAIAEIDNIDWMQKQTQTDLYIQPYQAVNYQVHTIFLRTYKEAFDAARLGHKLHQPEWNNYYKNADSVDTEWQVQLPSLYKILHWAQQKMNAKAIGNSMLNCMRPGEIIQPHIDEGPYNDAHCRFHIPLQTNSQVTWSGLSDSQEHMPVGWLYRLNNKCVHQVQNQGTTHRVHLVVDLLLDQPNGIIDSI
jgi:hypothetical protein